MLSPEPNNPPRPVTPTARKGVLPRESFAKSGLGHEVSPGHIVLSRQAFLFACGIIHFPDREAREALRSSLGQRNETDRSAGSFFSRDKLPEEKIAAPLGAYFLRLRDAYTSNVMSRRAIMSVAEPNRYQQLLLEVAPEVGLFQSADAHLPQALSYATQPWTVVLSEDFAKRNKVARNELTWLEFARGFAQPASRDESMLQEALEKGFRVVSDYLAAGNLQPIEAMRFAGLDTSPFSRYSLWYFHAAPDIVASCARQGAAGELAQDHTKRSLFFKKLVRDAASCYAAQGNGEACESLRSCSRLAASAYEDALARIDRLVKALPGR